MEEPETKFGFGKNWQQFLNKLGDEEYESAEKSLSEFLNIESFEGKTFVDAGCGSGLFSRAAYKKGAERVVSLDVDPFSIKCCKYLHEKEGSPDNWTVQHGSVLDKPFLESLGKFDVVYSWGVLHHTGAMWDAIYNTAAMVKENGYYYIAIYNKMNGWRGSEFWLAIKKIYNFSPYIVKLALEGIYRAVFFLRRIIRFQNPFKEIREYKKTHRSMDWGVDITDWIGGYPYEYATVDEVFNFVKKHFPQFTLSNILTTDNVGANWFVFVNSPIKALAEKEELVSSPQDA